MWRLRLITPWLTVVLLLGTPAAEAANAAQIQNYDRWKSLPSQALLDKGNSYWQSGQLDSALVCLTILSNRYNEKMPLAEKELNCHCHIGHYSKRILSHQEE